MKILQLVSLKQYTLLVFATPDYCYQFSIIADDGFVSTSNEIFETYQRAEQEGRFAIGIASS